MKLLQVVWNFPDTVMQPFDMYYFYWPVYEAVQRGWQAEVLTFQVQATQPRTEVIDGIMVRRCPAGRRKGRPFSPAFIHALLTTDADIIHCHGYGEGRSELALWLGRLRGRAVIFTPHFHVYPYRRPVRECYDRTLGRLMLNMSSRVIVFTAYTQRHLCSLGVQAEKLSILPHVARPAVFQAQEDKAEAGTLLKAAGLTGFPLLLGVGQLIERKGWHYTLECLPAIVARFPTARLLLLGPSQPTEPSFRQRLLQRAEQLGVRDNLSILQDNTPTLIHDAYRCAALLTHPSFVESFGMVLLEAMTAGLPVVAHNGTGIPCIVEDGVTGYVVDVRDTEMYTNALLRLLSNPELRHTMGQAGQQQAFTRFSQQTIAEQLFALYADVTEDRRNKSVSTTLPTFIP